jgi:ABC-2 type transport system ATP-binding protein
MREAEELCDEIAFIKRGQILAQGTAGDLKRRIRIGDVIALRVDPPRPAALETLPGLLRHVESDGWLVCTVDTARKRLPELLRLLHDKGVIVHDIQVREPELEDVFVELAR